MSRLIGKCLVFIATAALSALPAQSQQTPTDATERQIRIAAEEASRGDMAGALADAKAATALDPESSDGWYELGSLLGQAGDFSGAEAALRRAIELTPDFAKAHYSLALTMIGDPQGKMDWSTAIAECREAIKEQPNYPEAVNLLGSGLLAIGHQDAAIDELRHAIQLSPTLAEAHLQLGQALESKERFEEAAKEYRAAIAARESYAAAHSALGALLLRMGTTVEAEQELNQALVLNPDLTSGHYALARLLHGLGRKSEAEIEFAETKDLSERPANGIQSAQLSNEALRTAARGDLIAAAVELRKAIALKPDYGVPHYNLGLILADSGDASGALRELAQAISLLPGQARLWFDYGRMLRRVDYGRALVAVAWAARLSPSDSSIQAELVSLRGAGTMQSIVPNTEEVVIQPKVGAATDTAQGHAAFALELMDSEDFQGAIGELLRSLFLDPSSVETRRRLAVSYVLLGDHARAKLEYAKVLRSAPDNASDRVAMGTILLADGDAVGAVGQFRKALGSRPDSREARAGLDRAEQALAQH